MHNKFCEAALRFEYWACQKVKMTIDRNCITLLPYSNIVLIGSRIFSHCLKP